MGNERTEENELEPQHESNESTSPNLSVNFNESTSPIKKDDSLRRKLKKLLRTELSPTAREVINDVLKEMKKNEEKMKFLNHDFSKMKDDYKNLEDKLEHKIELLQTVKVEKDSLSKKVQVYELFLGSRQRFEDLRKKIIPGVILGNEKLTYKQKLLVSFDLQITKMSRIMLWRLRGKTLSVSDLINGEEKLYKSFSNPIHEGIKPRLPKTNEEWQELFQIATAVDADEKLSLQICLPGTTEEEIKECSFIPQSFSYIVHVKNIPKTTNFIDLGKYLSGESFANLKLKKHYILDSNGKFTGEMYVYIGDTSMLENDVFNLLLPEQIDGKKVFISTCQLNHLLI